MDSSATDEQTKNFFFNSTVSTTASTSSTALNPPLKGLFYAQFDDQVGPQFVHVVPTSLVLDDTVMEKVATYVLPKLELCGSLFTIRLGQRMKLMSCPLYIESKRYARHRFTFAFGMVFAGVEDDIGPYGPVLKKIAHFFLKLEEDAQFLSQGQEKGRFGQLLARIMEGLVSSGECIVRVLDAKTSLALKLFPKLLDPPLVGDFQVPVFIRSLRNVIVKDWDFTIQRLERHIDGKKFVKRIALESGMDISLVRRALRQLLYYRVIIMLDVFQYSNLYCSTRKLADLASNEALQTECKAYVTRNSSEGMTNTILRPQQLPFSKIFQLYASIHPSAPFGDFCIEYNTEAFGIDDQRFITFGLRCGILRRVRHVPIPLVYPLPGVSGSAVDVSAPPAMKRGESFANNSGDTQSAQIRALVDSERSFDELCGITTFSFAEVKTMFDAMDDVVVVKL